MVHRLTRAAEQQIDTLLLDSARNFGLEAASRYSELIRAVMVALGKEQDLIGSVPVPRLEGVRAYPIRLARRRVDPAHRVSNPRHLVLYRVAADGAAEILGLVHDRMVLSRAARRIVRITDQT